MRRQGGKGGKGGQRPTVGIVGPGRAGLGLALALKAAGVLVLGVHGRRRKRVPRGVRLSVGDAPPWLPDADVVLLAVRDDALPDAVRRLQSGGVWVGQVVLHLSGAQTAAVLAPLARLGAYTGSLHPLMTVSGDPAAARERFHGATFAIEGDAEALSAAAALARRLGGFPVHVPPSARPRYHAGAVFASNYVVAMLGAAEVLLMAAGFPDAAARRALAPLAAASLASVREAGPVRALTGPIARGDVATLERHLEALPGALRPTYADVGLVALRLAELAGLPPGAAGRVRKTLGRAVRLRRS